MSAAAEGVVGFGGAEKPARPRAGRRTGRNVAGRRAGNRGGRGRRRLRLLGGRDTPLPARRCCCSSRPRSPRRSRCRSRTFGPARRPSRTSSSSLPPSSTAGRPRSSSACSRCCSWRSTATSRRPDALQRLALRARGAGRRACCGGAARAVPHRAPQRARVLRGRHRPARRRGRARAEAELRDHPPVVLRLDAHPLRGDGGDERDPRAPLDGVAVVGAPDRPAARRRRAAPALAARDARPPARARPHEGRVHGRHLPRAAHAAGDGLRRGDHARGARPRRGDAAPPDRPDPARVDAADEDRLRRPLGEPARRAQGGRPPPDAGRRGDRARGRRHRGGDSPPKASRSRSRPASSRRSRPIPSSCSSFSPTSSTTRSSTRRAGERSA